MTTQKATNRRLMHPYARILHRDEFGSLAQLDGRTHNGRLARDLGAALAEYLGGDLTIVQRLLIERICKLKMQLEAFDAKLEGDGWTRYDTKVYGGLNSAYRLALRELEATRPRPDTRKRGRTTGLSLEEVITEHRRPV